MERLHEDHWLEEKTVDGQKSLVQRSTIFKETGTSKKISLPNSTVSSSNALPYFKNFPAITNDNNGNNLALVRSTSSDTTHDPHGGQILRTEDVQNRTFKDKGYAYFEETTVTTTVTKRVIMQSGDAPSMPKNNAAPNGIYHKIKCIHSLHKQDILKLNNSRHWRSFVLDV